MNNLGILLLSTFLASEMTGGYTPDPVTTMNIDKVTVDNENYRKVIYTSDNMQLVLMSLKPGVEIGLENHDNVDQFIRVEKGSAKYVKGGRLIDYDESNKNVHITDFDSHTREPKGTLVEYESGDLPADNIILVPKHTWHNIWNDGPEDVKIYTIYSFDKQNPAHSPTMKTQVTKEDEKYEEH